MTLTNRQKVVLDAIVNWLEETGEVPTPSRIKKLTGLGWKVYPPLRSLVTQGYLTYPYGGRSIPLKSSEGGEISITLLRVRRNGNERIHLL